MLNKLNQNSLNTLATEDNHFEDLLNEFTDDLKPVLAGESTVTKSKKKQKDILKRHRDEVAPEVTANTMSVQQRDISLKPQTPTDATQSIDRKTRMTGANAKQSAAQPLVTKETSSLVLKDTKQYGHSENPLLKEKPLMVLKDTKQYGHSENPLLKEKPLMVLNRVSIQSQGVKLPLESSAFMPLHAKSIYSSHNQKWPVAFSAIKDIQPPQISIDAPNHLNGTHTNIFGIEPKIKYVDSGNFTHSFLQTFPVMSSNNLNYSLSPAFFWQYPQVNSYRVFFARKYYLFTFENKKVTSFLEEYYDRT
ncbi:hypothetical protein CCZ37_07290 [Vibrio qinghaiensis]|uniref:Uncharacterized protein n=1 Tax=Vibrio qinghaiensis TaxID=2025808 RepID=A0A223MXW8_9VIBR|nr:hypothetical protein [Vibrio qinghaiensis]ASU22405.1 hypothetical protein CCZ37_07290 [Vibrio qinghaiensis]